MKIGESFPSQRNLVEKVNAKKKDLRLISNLNFFQCQGLTPLTLT